MKKKLLKVTKRSLAAVLAVTMAAPLPVPVMKEAKAADAPVKADIYPLPQEVKYSSEEGMSFEGTVNVVMHGGQEHATETKLDEILKENGIDYVITEHKDESKANIIISSDPDHCEECAVQDEVFKNKEAYILTSSNDTNSKGEVTIVGADEDGAYDGVLSLAQILEQGKDGKFAELVVKDYPEIEFRGFIEGFYGYPWSHEDRMSLMKDTGKYKMNTYIYAPKDDPYHRAKWRDLYPEKEAAQIAELAQTGKDSNFNFCWTIHPGDSLDLYSEADFKACIAKLEQLYGLGVRQFGVLFDDISRNQNGSLQAQFINRIDDEFVKSKGDVKPLIMVGTRYCAGWGPDMTSYFKPLVQTLHSDIEVMWTGANTMSQVSKEIYDWPAKQTGIDRELAVWWNYPVNDYCDAKLLMGAMPNLIPDLDNVNSFFSNPMNQAEASKVSLYSVADYTWNTDAYDYQASWERSVEELVPEAAEEFKRFASNISYLKDGLTVGESEYLQEKADALTAAVAAKGDVASAAKDLLAEFKLMKEDCAKLKKLHNANLQKEIAQHLGAYEELADACISAMNAMIAAAEGKAEVSLEEAAKAEQFLDNMNNYKVEQLENSGTQQYIVDVGTHLLKPLVKRSVADAQDMICDYLSPVLPAEFITNVKGLTGEVSIDNGSYVTGRIAADLKPGEYAGMVLPKVTPISKAAAEGTDFEGCDFEYSVNGVEWTKADAASVSKVYATYFRVVNNTDETIHADLTRLTATPVYKIHATADTSLGTYESYYITNVTDSSLYTKFWSNAAPSKGDHVTVDLGTYMPVYDVTGYFGSGDRFEKGVLMISEDGKNFTKVEDVSYVMENGNSVTRHNLDGQMARYIRFQEESTNNGYWLQCFGITVNETIDSGEDMETIALAKTNTNGDASKVYDSNLTTAFAPTAVTGDSHLTYEMSRINDVHELSVIQSKDSICNAKVSIKDASGEWKEVGILDKQITKFKVDRVISEVRLDFDDKSPAPVIYEIFVSQREAVKEDIYKVTVDGQEVASGAYNTKVTIKAPAAEEGKEFKGWKLNGVFVSENPSYTFFIAGDMNFEACYDEVKITPQAMLVATHLTKQEAGKADAKFVGQLVVPKGSRIVRAGLVWGSNESVELALNSGAKVTDIQKISTTYQFSVTIKGVPEGRFVRGKIFAVIADESGKETTVYSEQEEKVENMQ